MLKKINKAFSFVVCIAIIVLSVAYVPAKAIEINYVSFADKIVFENEVFVGNNAYDMNSTSEYVPESLSVTLRFEDSLVCEHGSIDSQEELTEHRQEVKEHYKALNEKIIDDLGLEDNADVSYSYYAPYIEYVYENYDSFMDADYDTLASINPSNMSRVYIRSNYGVEDEAIIGTESREEYDFGDALADVGVSRYKFLRPYDGTGIRVGVLESFSLTDYTNLDGIEFYTYGNNIEVLEEEGQQEHAFKVSSVLGGNSGIADGAALYLAAISSETNFLDCINWLLDMDVHVINGSFSFTVQQDDEDYRTGLYDSYAAFTDYAVSTLKFTYVASAGNQRNYREDIEPYMGSPSTGLNVISVASNDVDLKVSSFSSYSMTDYWELTNLFLKPTLTAPGGSIKHIDNVNGAISGTSYSAPIVTGIIALLMEEFPALIYCPEMVMALLTSTCTPAAGQNGTVDQDAGFGIVNYERAREAYDNGSFFNVADYNDVGVTVFSKTISVFGQKEICFTANLLYDSMYDTPYATLTTIPDPVRIGIRVYNEEGYYVANGTIVGNMCYVKFTTSGGISSYTIKVYYAQSSTESAGIAWGAVCYYID